MVFTKEQFFKEFVLSKEDLEMLEGATGITPERAIEIWELVKKTGVPEFYISDEKCYIQAIYDIIIDPDDEKEREEFPDVYLGLNPAEKTYAGYLLGLEQAFEIFNSVRPEV